MTTDDDLVPASWWGDSGLYGEWTEGHGSRGPFGDSPDVMLPRELFEAYAAAGRARDAAERAIDEWLTAHPEATLPLPGRPQPEWIDVTHLVRTVAD